LSPPEGFSGRTHYEVVGFGVVDAFDGEVYLRAQFYEEVFHYFVYGEVGVCGEDASAVL
jgi:hypothetical protein